MVTINLLAVHLYVWYRTPNPDPATVQVVQNELQDYNISTNLLVDWPNENC